MRKRGLRNQLNRLQRWLDRRGDFPPVREIVVIIPAGEEQGELPEVPPSRPGVIEFSYEVADPQEGYALEATTRQTEAD